MEKYFEQLPQSSSALPLQMTGEDKDIISEIAAFDDITEAQKDEFLALLWDIACTATLIHFGIHPIQSVVGKREALATHKAQDSVEST